MIVAVIQNTISLFKLGAVVYEINVISGYFVARLHIEVIQYVSSFIYKVKKSKILVEYHIPSDIHTFPILF